jgi:hypothetical protein
MTAPIDREGGVRVSQAARDAGETLYRDLFWKQPVGERVDMCIEALARFEAQAQVGLRKALFKLRFAHTPSKWDAACAGADEILARIEGGEQAPASIEGEAK